MGGRCHKSLQKSALAVAASPALNLPGPRRRSAEFPTRVNPRGPPYCEPDLIVMLYGYQRARYPIYGAALAPRLNFSLFNAVKRLIL